jgi:hypothetical protein
MGMGSVTGNGDKGKAGQTKHKILSTRTLAGYFRVLTHFLSAYAEHNRDYGSYFTSPWAIVKKYKLQVAWFPIAKGGVDSGRPLSLSTILKFETFIDKDRARDLATERAVE